MYEKRKIYFKLKLYTKCIFYVIFKIIEIFISISWNNFYILRFKKNVWNLEKS